MGLFGKKKKIQKPLASEKLDTLGFNPHSFDHANFADAEITIDDELAGVVKASSDLWENDSSVFDYVELLDFKNGSRELCLSTSSADERACQTTINILNEHLGEDAVFRTEFSSSDLDEIRKGQLDYPIRSWSKFEDFSIDLIPRLDKDYLLLIVKSIA